MNCLTYSESESWLRTIDIAIDEHRNLVPGSGSEYRRVMTSMPSAAARLWALAFKLSNWISHDVERLFWLSNWETEPREAVALFEILRSGCGEQRTLIEAPGLRILPNDERESEILCGCLFLTMAFNWEAYLVANNRCEFLFLGDEHIVFCNADARELIGVQELLSAFQLREVRTIREAWRSSAQ